MFRQGKKLVYNQENLFSQIELKMMNGRGQNFFFFHHRIILMMTFDGPDIGTHNKLNLEKRIIIEGAVLYSDHKIVWKAPQVL